MMSPTLIREYETRHVFRETISLPDNQFNCIREPKMDILEFIKKKKNNLKIGDWFKDIWYPLYYKEDILITNNILNFIYYGFGLVPSVGKLTCPLEYTKLKIKLRKSLKYFNIESENISYEELKNKKSKIYDRTIKEDLKYVMKNNIKSIKWIMLSRKSFKSLIMFVKTKNANIIKEYFINLEELLNDYSEYSKEKMYTEKIEQIENDLQRANRSNYNLRSMIHNIKTKNKNGFIYIATSRSYAQLNTFKIGMTMDVEKRLPSFNTNNTVENRFYYCFFEKVFNATKVEAILNDLLEAFKDKKTKEMVNMHYTYLEGLVKLVIKNINETYDHINDIIKNHLNRANNSQPLIPEEVIINTETENVLSELNTNIKNVFDRFVEENRLKLNRKQILSELQNVENISNISKWKYVKQYLNWKNSRTGVSYENKQLMITY
ncbi:uncharacterized protein PF3D7_1120600-like [Episyrphus balteatus]|uniref:uncharacterized protein PF3D7_1120600-like n=1 Tax=Episyrphus balteatus TaxID=286459 RepID=UPI002486BE46|nr:uncharacterized protein PF3D7_1120600-like [Episyrphus balteatus]XP_055836977.1 uncharacterized protein PF3D7_1120600-like [Episyrphus balteatus]XP_055836984.1 uncharacterized protein PF3D7_1120600-like [Episyrphus balteatus]XP_055836991.1 uncharacterized protein PF3D7_1120600-like [Episyrphus balteatus]XP_055836999.1 uncharacterized protein PF3D7_1120600-like [Episyrphus balteatus]XP_055837009.1 uncharacterized protein PF3D7_1120600-like [Episyrphus balteatus]